MRCPSPPVEPELDDHQLLRQSGFSNAEETRERCRLRQAKTMEGLPHWLVGLYYRLAPAVFDVEYLKTSRGWFGSEEQIQREAKQFRHLFDAIPMLQRFEIGADGQVYYSSKVLGRRVLEAWQSAKGQVPRSKDILQALYTRVRQGRGNWKDRIILPGPQNIIVGSTIVGNFPMGPYRGTEGRVVLHQQGLPIVQEVDWQSPAGKSCFAYSSLNDEFVGTPCAKPLFDPGTGKTLNILVEYGSKDFVTYRVVELEPTPEAGPAWEGPDQLGTVVAKFKARPALLESFAITTKYVIIPLFPTVYPATDQPSPFKDGTLVDGLFDKLRFDAHGDTLFYVVSRRDRCLAAVYRSEAAFAFNIVNAFESDNGDSIFLDISTYEDDRAIDALNISVLRQQVTRHHMPVPMLRRYCLLSLKEESARLYGAAGQLPHFPTAPYHNLAKQPLEFPLVAPSRVGSQAQFVYGLSVRKADQEKLGTWWNSIVKIDPLCPHDVLEWTEPGCFPGPPTFASRPNDVREDEAALLTTVLDVTRKRSFLLILDASTMSELGRFWLPVAVAPSHLGGCWLQSFLGPAAL
jgi:carotenoid cleavage dioxygenase-like enzyme